MKGYVKTVLIKGIAHFFEPLREAFCIAVFTSRTDLVDPVTDFQVTSVHSIGKLSDIKI